MLIRGVLLALISAQLVLFMLNGRALHRTHEQLAEAQQIFDRAREIMASLPVHPCGQVIQPGESCYVRGTIRVKPADDSY